MSKTQASRGDILTLTAPSGGVVSGAGVMIGGLFVVPIADAAEGEQFAGARAGAHWLTKTSGQSWSEGDQIFFNSSNGRTTNVSAVGLFPIGAAGADAASADGTGVVVLDGTYTEAV